MDFDKITESRIRQTSSIKDESGELVDFGGYIDFYSSKSYRSYSGSKGSTARRAWCFFDNSGNLLFKLTDLGNRNLIQISIDEKSTIYQYK